MLVTKDLAVQIEACIKQSHIEVTKQYVAGKVMEIKGGAACFSGKDSFLSQVVGWGFATKPKQMQTELSQITAFYKSLDHSRSDIELCPYAGQDLAVFLSQQHFGTTELNNVSYYNLSQHKKVVVDSNDFVIRQVNPHEFAQWARAVARAFGYPQAQEQFLHYVKAKGVTAFAVWAEDKIVSGATIAMHGDLCDLGVASTLPAYRGNGLQKKLLLTRLNFAAEHGLSLATVTTEPGTISDLNIQKMGFHCAYTRVKMTRYTI